MQPRAATGGSGPVITPIASITPYQVPFEIFLLKILSLLLWKSDVESSVVEQVDNQGKGDEQGRCENVEQVNWFWKTFLHGSYG